MGTQVIATWAELWKCWFFTTHINLSHGYHWFGPKSQDQWLRKESQKWSKHTRTKENQDSSQILDSVCVCVAFFLVASTLFKRPRGQFRSCSSDWPQQQRQGWVVERRRNAWGFFFYSRIWLVSQNWLESKWLNFHESSYTRCMQWFVSQVTGLLTHDSWMGLGDWSTTLEICSLQKWLGEWECLGLHPNNGEKKANKRGFPTPSSLFKELCLHPIALPHAIIHFVLEGPSTFRNS